MREINLAKVFVKGFTIMQSATTSIPISWRQRTQIQEWRRYAWPRILQISAMRWMEASQIPIHDSLAWSLIGLAHERRAQYIEDLGQHDTLSTFQNYQPTSKPGQVRRVLEYTVCPPVSMDLSHRPHIVQSTGQETLWCHRALL
jgi:hypothetical protein